MKSNLQFTYLAEMMAVDSQGNRQGQKFGTTKEGPYHQIPIVDAFLAENSDPYGGSKKRQKALEVNWD